MLAVGAYGKEKDQYLVSSEMSLSISVLVSYLNTGTTAICCHIVTKAAD